MIRAPDLVSTSDLPEIILAHQHVRPRARVRGEQRICRRRNKKDNENDGRKINSRKCLIT